MEHPYILVTNDDGIDAKGLLVLESIASRIGTPITVAPASQMSAVSQKITLSEPVRVLNRGENRYAVKEGTPADCVYIALDQLCTRKPDLVLSGINYGVNVATDIVYSGTVAAAREGVLHGIPSASVSMEAGADWDPQHGSDLVEKVILHFLANPSVHRSIFNINIPHVNRGAIKGVRASTIGQRRFSNCIDKRIDPQGRPYYWIGGEIPEYTPATGTDCKAVREGYISISPVRPVAIDQPAYEEMSDWSITE